MQQRPRHRRVRRQRPKPKPPVVRLGPGGEYLRDINPGTEPLPGIRPLFLTFILIAVIALFIGMRWLLIHYGGVWQ